MAITRIKKSGTVAGQKFTKILADNNPQADYFFLAYTTTPYGSVSFGDIHVDSSNNIYVIGNQGTTTPCLWRITPKGVVDKKFDFASTASPAPTSLSSMKFAGQDSSGNFYFAGQRNTSTQTGAFLFKLNSSFVLQWVKKLYIGSNNDFPVYISDANVSAGGNLRYTFAGNGSYYGAGSNWNIGAQNTSGNQKWAPYYIVQGGSTTYFGQALVNIDDDTVITTSYNSDGIRQVGTVARVTGNTASSNTWYAQTWNSGSSGNLNTNYYAVAKDSSNNIYVTGNRQDDSTVSIYSGILYKYNSSGTNQWYRRVYTGVSGGYTQFYDVETDSSGNVYACGYTSIDSVQRGIIVKYNTSGSLQWQRILTLSGGSLAFLDMKIDASDNIILYSNIYTSSSANLLYSSQGIFKIKSDGSGVGTYTWKTDTYTNTLTYEVSSLTSEAFSIGGSGSGTFSMGNTSGSVTDDTGTMTETTTIADYRVKGNS